MMRFIVFLSAWGAYAWIWGVTLTLLGVAVSGVIVALNYLEGGSIRFDSFATTLQLWFLGGVALGTYQFARARRKAMRAAKLPFS